MSVAKLHVLYACSCIARASGCGVTAAGRSAAVNRHAPSRPPAIAFPKVLENSTPPVVVRDDLVAKSVSESNTRRGVDVHNVVLFHDKIDQGTDFPER